MKAQAVLSIILILVPSLSGFHDTFLLASPSLVTEEEQIVIGRLGEDIILPCSFESEPEVVIHWKNQDKYAYSYYKDRDYLENQDHKYTNRTSLFHSEIHNGNASLSLRRLSLLDEGIYVCYVGTTSRKIINKVVLKVGVFVTPVMKYEKRNIDSFLICSVLSYPHPLITWKTDNTSISESNMGEIESLDPFYVYSMINITGSNLSYECAIENSLLKQTWTGGWTMKDDLHKMQSENFSLSCALTNSIFLLDQDFIVTWYNMEKETSSILAFFLSSSRNATIYEPRVSWNKEQINQSDFSLTLKDLSLSDSGKYLCNISSSKYTFLTIQTLHVVVYTKQSIRTIPSLTKEASQNLPFSRKPWPVETRGGLPTLPPPEREQSQSRTAWIIILPLVILGFLAIGIFCMLKRHNCSRRERSSEGPY